VAASCLLGNEPSGFMKDGEFLVYLSHCQLLKKASARGVTYLIFPVRSLQE
jgi:hypothetical protein